MELSLVLGKPNATLTDGDGGAYYAWTPAHAPVLASMALGAAKLMLRPRGLAFPHYSDSHKIGLALQGKCTVGFVSPNNPEEKIMILEEGNTVAVPMGMNSWWFNDGDSDVAIIFLGESKESYSPGIFNYFLLTGAMGMLGGFSTDFISKIYGLNDVESKKLVKSQSSPFIVKVGEKIQMPLPQAQAQAQAQEEYIFNITSEITGLDYPSLDKIGLSAGLMTVEGGSVTKPSYSADASHRLIYVKKGSGRVEIVGLKGAQVVNGNMNVEEGDLFVVPRFFTFAVLAAQNGLDFFYVTTSSRPVLGEFSGKASVLKALSDPILQVSMNVSPQFVKLFKDANHN